MTLQVDGVFVPESVEEFAEGSIVCEWFFNKQIISYKLLRVSHAIVHEWAEIVESTIRSWDKTQPYLALHDLSTAGVSLQYASMVEFDTTNIGVTPKGKQVITQLVDSYPDFFASVAFNFSMSLSGQVNRVLAHRSQMQSFISYKLFYNREKSLAWLSTQLASR